MGIVDEIASSNLGGYVCNWGGSYYTPPQRDWAFDPDLDDPSNMPPGTPMVRSFVRWGWKQINVGYGAQEYSSLVSTD